MIMKFNLVINIICWLCTFTVNAQLAHLVERVHYTLIETTADSLGQAGDIELINAPYQGAAGIFCYGGYINDVPGADYDSSLVVTPNIEFLAAQEFAVSIEFKLDTLDHTIHSILVLGNGWRFLGLGILYNSILGHHEFFPYMNNAFGNSIPIVIPEKNIWYKLILYHNRDEAITKFFLNGELIDSLAGSILHGDNDFKISNTNFGNGTAHRGFLRQLRVYSSEISTTLFSTINNPIYVKTYPNPIIGNNLHVQLNLPEPALLRCISLDGIIMYEQKLNHRVQALELTGFPRQPFILSIITEQKVVYTSLIMVH